MNQFLPASAKWISIQPLPYPVTDAVGFLRSGFWQGSQILYRHETKVQGHRKLVDACLGLFSLHF